MNGRRIFFCAALILVLLLSACIDPFLSFFQGGNQDYHVSSTFTSIEIKGTPYNYGSSAPVPLITDEIFQFKVVLQNNGTSTWGNAASGQHGASLLSRGDPGTEVNGKRPDDYNETFGTFFILYPMQFGVPHGSNDPTVRPGSSWEIDTLLRTPGTPGTYTMRWQTAAWPLGTSVG